MSEIIYTWTGIILIIITLPGSIEILLLTICSLLKAENIKTRTAKKIKIAVIIPAHNEEGVIQRAINSIKKCEDTGDRVEIVVIADNCTDRTVRFASSAYARVIKRVDLQNRGKGQALNFAFNILIREKFNAFIVLDADSVVEKNFIAEFSELFRAGADAVQCRYLVKNPDDSSRTRLMNLALSAMHVVRPLGRSNLKVSCGIFGNGFGLTRKVLEEVPYIADSITEDLEYHFMLIKAGKKVSFANLTTVKADFPQAGQTSITQRERWEGGRLRMMLEKGPLFLQEILKGNRRFLEPFMEIMTLPLSYHMSLLIITMAVPTIFSLIYSISSLCIILFHIITTIIIAGEKKDMFALATVPYYMIWKIARLGGIIKNSKTDVTWVRTARGKEKR